MRFVLNLVFKIQPWKVIIYIYPIKNYSVFSKINRATFFIFSNYNVIWNFKYIIILINGVVACYQYYVFYYFKNNIVRNKISFKKWLVYKWRSTLMELKMKPVKKKCVRCSWSTVAKEEWSENFLHKQSNPKLSLSLFSFALRCHLPNLTSLSPHPRS